MKKYVKICEILFKNWKLLFENTKQTLPKIFILSKTVLSFTLKYNKNKAKGKIHVEFVKC